MRPAGTRRPATAAVGSLLAGLVLAGEPARAQPCEPLPTDRTSQTRYQARVAGPRCEGMFSSPVAGEAGPVVGEQGIALVSLTFGRVNYQLDQDRELAIRLPRRRRSQLGFAGSASPCGNTIGWNSEWATGQRELRVPLGDVIQPERLGPELIGVFGYRDLPGAGRGYVPVYTTAPGSPEAEGIVALFRPSVEVRNVAWRLTGAGGAPMDWTPVQDARGLVPEGTVLVIPLGRVLPGARTILGISYYLNGVERSVPFVLLAP